jgi:hypothetical protein
VTRVLIDFAPADKGRSGRLYRALRDDVDFPFVEIRYADSPERRRGVFEIVHEDGDPDGDGGVVLIDPFEVPIGGDEDFLAGWDAAREILAGAQGYLGTRLHRSLGAADFRFVNIVRWSSPLMFARARKPAMPFASHPALYLPVSD